VAVGTRAPRPARSRAPARAVRQPPGAMERDQCRPLLGILLHLAVAASDRRAALLRLHGSHPHFAALGRNVGDRRLRRAARAGALEARREAAIAPHLPAGGPRAAAPAARSDRAAYAAGPTHRATAVAADGRRPG